MTSLAALWEPITPGIVATANSWNLPRAKNIIEFITSSEYLNQTAAWDYWGSLQTLIEFFELYCPNCNRGPLQLWGKTKKQITQLVLLEYNQAIDQDQCPKCKTTRLEFEQQTWFTGFNQYHLLAGQRSGKTFTGAQIACYIEHIYHCTAQTHPIGFAGYLNLSPDTKFSISFMAQSLLQNKETMWAIYRSIRTRSPWFQRYVLWVKNEEEKQKTTSGMRPWIYDEQSVNIIHNEHPKEKLIIDALTSNSNAQAGRTRVCSFIDEMARMERGSGPRSAREIYTTQEASLLTARARRRYTEKPNHWIGAIFSCTSTMSRADYAWELWQSKDKIPNFYSRRKATWDFNPNVTRKDLSAEWAKNPVDAERNFGANPPGAANPLIMDPKVWYDLTIDLTAKPTADVRAIQQDGFVKAYLDIAQRDYDTPRIICWDTAHNHDSFSGACAHLEYDTTGRKIVVYDWVLRLLPSHGQRVDFDSVTEFQRQLSQFHKVIAVIFDRWNTVQLIQQTERIWPSAMVFQRSTTSEDYVKWMRASMEGRIRMLPGEAGEVYSDQFNGLSFAHPPTLKGPACAIYEALGMERDPITDKVHNPNKGKEQGHNSDDTIQVCVAAAWMCLEGDYKIPRPKNQAAVAISTQLRNQPDMGSVFTPSASRWYPGRGSRL